MEDYTFKIDERDGKFWAVVCRTRPIQVGVHVRRSTKQEEGPYDTPEEAEKAGKEIEERFSSLKAFW